MPVYTYDDGSQIGVAEDGSVLSREIGAATWQDDPLPAPSGWGVFSGDMAEAAKMGAAYPSNGAPWYENAATLGISRVIDSAARAFVQVKGSQPATFAGQNGQTYVNGATAAPAQPFGVSPLILLLGLGAALLLLKKG
jgi:hypothetical protein